MPEPKSIKEYECAFQDRFDPPTGAGTAWSYGRNESEMHEIVAFICDHWPIYGHSFFDRYSEFPKDFIAIIEDVDASDVHPSQLVTLASIAAYLQFNDRAKELAEEGLRRCPERATGLKDSLNKILGNATNRPNSSDESKP
jgi:hypothetical protein